MDLSRRVGQGRQLMGVNSTMKLQRIDSKSGGLGKILFILRIPKYGGLLAKNATLLRQNEVLYRGQFHHI